MNYPSEITLVENPKNIVYEEYPAVKEELEKLQVSSEKMFEKIKNQLGETSCTVKTISKSGDPASVLIDLAEEMGCDLIMMCSHRMSALRRFLVGNVTNKVVHHSKVSVLVIR